MQVSSADPGKKYEEDGLDSRWGPVISKVANEKMSGLSARDRLLLALYYLRGVSLKAISRQFGIHEATVSRWLDRLRREIRNQVERELRKKHGLRASEIQSLWRWISIPSVRDAIAGELSPATDANMENPGGQVQKKSARHMD